MLFINGELDDRTPVQLAESARKGFPHSRLVVVRNGGHELLPGKAVQKLVADFFAGADSEEVEVALAPRVFATIDESAHPPSHPR